MQISKIISSEGVNRIEKVVNNSPSFSANHIKAAERGTALLMTGAAALTGAVIADQSKYEKEKELLSEALELKNCMSEVIADYYVASNAEMPIAEMASMQKRAKHLVSRMIVMEHRSDCKLIGKSRNQLSMILTEFTDVLKEKVMVKADKYLESKPQSYDNLSKDELNIHKKQVEELLENFEDIKLIRYDREVEDDLKEAYKEICINSDLDLNSKSYKEVKQLYKQIQRQSIDNIEDDILQAKMDKILKSAIIENRWSDAPFGYFDDLDI